MKRKLNVIITLAIAGLITTAYATCSLNQVVLCWKAGDNLGIKTLYYWNGTSTTFSANVYATTVSGYGNAYRIDTYTVTSGGFPLGASVAAACENTASPSPDYTGKTYVHFTNPFTMSAVEDSNPTTLYGPTQGQNYYLNTITTHFADSSMSNCN